jgi:hypothetical protein
MLFSGRDQDDVTWPDLLDRAAPPLHAAASGRHDQRLSEWVRMPIRARARLERNVRAAGPRGIVAIKERIDANGSRKV